jgi:hypothetical protein
MARPFNVRFSRVEYALVRWPIPNCNANARCVRHTSQVIERPCVFGHGSVLPPAETGAGHLAASVPCDEWLEAGFAVKAVEGPVILSRATIHVAATTQ